MFRPANEIKFASRPFAFKSQTKKLLFQDAGASVIAFTTKNSTDTTARPMDA